MMFRWNGLVKAKVMEGVCPRVMSILSWRGKVLCLHFSLRFPAFIQGAFFNVPPPKISKYKKI